MDYLIWEHMNNKLRIMNQESRIMGVKNIIKSISRGFTLIELMVAIAIVGVLASATVVALNPLEQFAKARDAQRKNDLLQIRNALELYYNDNNRYPPVGGINSDLVAGIAWGDQWGSYMTKLPKDPSSPGQEYKYERDGAGTYFRLYAKLERCSDAQTIPGTCGTTSHNYAVTSTNAIAIALPTFTPTPTNTPTPTSTPTPLPRKVFVTSQTYDGSLGGLNGADAKCQLLADAQPSLSGKIWKAWLSDSTGSPSTRFTKYDVPYELVNGTRIADNWDDLVDVDLLVAPINKTEAGLAPPVESVRTNTIYAGTVYSGISHCTNWTSSSGSNIRYGFTSVTTSSWTNGGSTTCGPSLLPLYCFEQ